MSLLAYILLFCLFGGALSVLGAALVLRLKDAALTRVMPHLISFAIGTLLGAALLGLLPEALADPARASHKAITATLLLGLLGFFLLEKLVLWRHCHADHCEAHDPALQHNGAAGTLVLIGDGIHNFVDGVLIAAAFLTDVQLGIVTSLAAAAHEIPQEMGDFAILLHSGFSRAKALAYNLLSSVATVLGGLLAYFSLKDLTTALPYVLTLAAASFLYIAVADLIPGLHKSVQPAATGRQVLLISLGVAVIYAGQVMLH